MWQASIICSPRLPISYIKLRCFYCKSQAIRFPVRLRYLDAARKQEARSCDVIGREGRPGRGLSLVARLGDLFGICFCVTCLIFHSLSHFFLFWCLVFLISIFNLTLMKHWGHVTGERWRLPSKTSCNHSANKLNFRDFVNSPCPTFHYFTTIFCLYLTA